jgi:hypothetical protein
MRELREICTYVKKLKFEPLSANKKKFDCEIFAGSDILVELDALK